MTRLKFQALVALAIAALAGSEAPAQNLLANPGFEDPITMDGAPFVGSWEGFNGGAGSSAANSSLMARTGAMHLDVSITNTDNIFAGVFQDVEGLLPGQPVTFSLWHKTTTNPLDLVAEMRIEWRKTGQSAEVSRTPNSLPTLTSDYTQFSLTAPVPAGADTARVVYAIQTFGGGPTNNGTVFIDDASLVVIPEPSTWVLLSLGGCALAMLRRRRG
jgi:hypothetical protein